MSRTMPQHNEIFDALVNARIDELEKFSAALNTFPDGRDDFLGRHWITNAIDCGLLQAVVWVLKQGVELNFRDEEGCTVFHSCIDRELPDKYEILQRLIDAGADVNAKGFNDWTPLHMAAVRCDTPALRILLQAGADRTIKTEIDHYATPAEEAKIRGLDEIATFIENF